MSATPRTWFLHAAALIAIFQAWLWFLNSNYFLSAALIALAVGLVVVAHAPQSALSRILRRTWEPPRRAAETERRFRLRIALYWLVVAAISFLVLRFTPIHERSHEDELRNQVIFWPLALLVFCAVLMSVQSVAMAYKPGSDS